MQLFLLTVQLTHKQDQPQDIPDILQPIGMLFGQATASTVASHSAAFMPAAPAPGAVRT
jgi:hypothetical protein